jgi:hypothetical protein
MYTTTNRLQVNFDRMKTVRQLPVNAGGTERQTSVESFEITTRQKQSWNGLDNAPVDMPHRDSPNRAARRAQGWTSYYVGEFPTRGLGSAQK